MSVTVSDDAARALLSEAMAKLAHTSARLHHYVSQRTPLLELVRDVYSCDPQFVERLGTEARRLHEGSTT